MNLYYVTGTELKKDKKGNPIGVTDTHAIIARDDKHLSEKCDIQFTQWSDPSQPYKLNKDWDNFPG